MIVFQWLLGSMLLCLANAADVATLRGELKFASFPLRSVRIEARRVDADGKPSDKAAASAITVGDGKLKELGIRDSVYQESFELNGLAPGGYLLMAFAKDDPTPIAMNSLIWDGRPLPEPIELRTSPLTLVVVELGRREGERFVPVNGLVYADGENQGKANDFKIFPPGQLKLSAKGGGGCLVREREIVIQAWLQQYRKTIRLTCDPS